MAESINTNADNKQAKQVPTPTPPPAAKNGDKGGGGGSVKEGGATKGSGGGSLKEGRSTKGGGGGSGSGGKSRKPKQKKETSSDGASHDQAATQINNFQTEQLQPQHQHAYLQMQQEAWQQQQQIRKRYMPPMPPPMPMQLTHAQMHQMNQNTFTRNQHNQMMGSPGQPHQSPHSSHPGQQHQASQQQQQQPGQHGMPPMNMHQLGPYGYPAYFQQQNMHHLQQQGRFPLYHFGMPVMAAPMNNFHVDGVNPQAQSEKVEDGKEGTTAPGTEPAKKKNLNLKIRREKIPKDISQRITKEEMDDIIEDVKTRAHVTEIVALMNDAGKITHVELKAEEDYVLRKGEMCLQKHFRLDTYLKYRSIRFCTNMKKKLILRFMFVQHQINSNYPLPIATLKSNAPSH
jgi:hypothetical protein